MTWIKKGLVYSANKKYHWNQSHAQVPVVDMINDDVWRIYYSTRGLDNKSNTSYIEVDAKDPSIVLYEHDTPILELGSLGTFDDCGIMPSSIINVGDKKYLYYIGWTTRGSVPYHNSIGLAVSEDGGKTFSKKYQGPIITTTHQEPYFTGTCFVLKDADKFKAWYLSCIEWRKVNNRVEPLYHIKYAESKDGIQWERNGMVAIELQDANEGGLVSAAVTYKDGGYLMWYGYRKLTDYRENKEQSYRIGYAESADGINWIRKDNLSGIDIATDGWDSEMISYPYVVEHHDTRFLFYNGNGFGKTGFGYAIQNK